MKVHIITIGDEILIGQIVDTNSAWMSQQLNLQGHTVVSRTAVGDQNEAIIDAIDEGLQKADLILLTGGLGATKDDITKKAIAEYLGVPMLFHQDTYNRLEAFYTKLGRVVTEISRNGCYIPEGAIILENNVGLAPGMWFDIAGKVMVSMPGVPFEMQHLMTEAVLPRIKVRFGMTPIVHRTILTIGEGENAVAEKIATFEENLPSYIKLAFLPSIGYLRLRLTAIGDDETQLNQELDAQVQTLKTYIEPIIFGYEEDTLPMVIGRILREKGLQVGTAESCTGGLMAHYITSVPGSSAYYQGSIVAYSYEIKENLLGVSADTLQQFGAVSKETVIEMAKGALTTLKVDVAVAISGIAGPNGGTPEKPVGTFCVAVANKDHAYAIQMRYFRDRAKNIEYSAFLALEQLRKFLLKYY